MTRKAVPHRVESGRAQCRRQNPATGCRFGGQEVQTRSPKGPEPVRPDRSSSKQVRRTDNRGLAPPSASGDEQGLRQLQHAGPASDVLRVCARCAGDRKRAKAMAPLPPFGRSRRRQSDHAACGGALSMAIVGRQQSGGPAIRALRDAHRLWGDARRRVKAGLATDRRAAQRRRRCGPLDHCMLSVSRPMSGAPASQALHSPRS